MAEYRVDADGLELPRGSVFTTIPKCELEHGDFALFSLAGVLLPGRWFNGNQSICILIPGFQIKLSGTTNVINYGLIIPLHVGSGFNRVIRTSLLFGMMSLIDFLDLIAPLAELLA